MPRETQASDCMVGYPGVTLEPLAGVGDQGYLPATFHSWAPPLLAGFSEANPPSTPLVP